MARNRTLLSLLQDYRIETGASSNPAHNANARESQVQAIQKAQERLWRKHEWPFLRVRRFIDLQAGQRYYDTRGAKREDGTAAADLGIERLESIEVRWGEQWIPLCYGIGAAQYAEWDSDMGARSWPAERWQVYEDEQFEVWPIPSDNADPTTLEGRLRLTGIRDLRPLVSDDDRADLDDDLIVKWGALKALARAGSKDAQVVLDEAKQIEAGLTAGFTKSKTFSLAGRDSTPERRRRGPFRVHYRDNEPGVS
ncbi:hypothetical protein [Thauera sp.]|uniref:phage adaptor protein n=1 Tax=Thauera sp. TaxID=1905334 RepID=UPI002BA30056|nr:hypothetical protein [Thauera sp.]HRP25395.1 hypothetical protein [Thauera sp.]